MTEKEAFEIARRNGYGYEVMEAILDGFTPEEALEQYDCLPNTYGLEEVDVPELMTEEEIDIILNQDEYMNDIALDDYD